MDDSEIDAYITERIARLGVTFYDMLGGREVSPEPEGRAKAFDGKTRPNVFITDYSSTRMCELLTEAGDFDPEHPYENLAVSLGEVIRYWWNRVTNQEDTLEDIFDAIETYREAGMSPGEAEKIAYGNSQDDLLNESGESEPGDLHEEQAIPLSDVVGYWWNNVADREQAIEEILDAVMSYYEDRMLPLPDKEDVIDPEYSHAFDRILEVV